MTKYRFGKKAFLLLLLTVLCGLSFSVSAAFSFADQGKYDASYWRDSKDAAIAADADGNITVNAQFREDDSSKAIANGAYYMENLADRAKLEKTGAISVCVEFSFTEVVVPLHFIPVISNRALTGWMGGMYAEDGGEYVGNSSHLAGARLYYQSEARYNTNSILIRVCDYANYRTADYFPNVNPRLQIKHTLTYLITEQSLTMEFDGQPLTSNGAPYALQREKDVNWTLSDFVDEEGNPAVYFGFINGGFGNITVHGISSGNSTVQVCNFEGSESVLSDRDGAACLTDGSAYSTEIYRASDRIQGEFTVNSVPSYVYEGVPAEERDSVAKTWFRVNFKDSVATAADGNGFRITWYPLEETGGSRTEIEFGYIGNGMYHSLKTYLVGVPATGVHWFSVLSGEGWFQLIADGESVFVEIAADNGLYDMYESMNRDSLRLYYTADGGYPQTCPGKWEVLLRDASLLSDSENFVQTGNITLAVSGEYRESTVEKDGKSYQLISENEVLTVSGNDLSGALGGGVYAAVPVKLFSRLDANLEMTLEIGSLPVYDGIRDMYIGLFFSAVPGGTTSLTEERATFALILRRKSAGELSVYCKMGNDAAERTVAVSGDRITVTFGWSESASEIGMDGETLLAGTLAKGSFNSADGLQGYFSVKRYSETADNWSFAVSAPCHKIAESSAEPGGDEPELPENPPSGGCNSSLSGQLSVAGVLLIGFVLFVRKKSGKNEKRSTL